MIDTDRDPTVPTQLEILDSIVKELATARRLQANAQARLKEEVSKFEADRYVMSLRKDLHEIADYIERTEADIRILALEIYEQDGNKAPTQGVQVKIYRTPAYGVDQARQYSMEMLPICMKLDIKEFERIVKRLDGTPMALNFVGWVEEPRVTISKDLDKAEPESNDVN